jgi:LmbE family N-acetylglucosaminyl deacetylase
MLHIYLSPHLDDAIYSCGGLICQQRKAGEPVTVLNLCAGIPDYDLLTPFALSYHRQWGDGCGMVEARRAEDAQTLAALGVKAINLDPLDAIYRTVDDRPAYPDVKALFSSPHPQDMAQLPQLWAQRARELLPPNRATRYYAPLAIGGHVDHFLARLAGLQLAGEATEVWFYEDFPHAEDPLTLEKLGREMGLEHWLSHTILIDVQAKINAMLGYVTQTGMIFGDSEGLAHRVKDFTAERARHIQWQEKLRYQLAGSGGRRERVWRKILGYHAHAERFWSKR